jgi:hypothetical protein
MLKTKRILILALGVIALGIASVASVASADVIEAPCTLDKYTQMSNALVDRNYTLVGGLVDYVQYGYPLGNTLYKFDIAGLTEPVASASLVVDRVVGNMAPATDSNPLTVYVAGLGSDVETWTEMDTSQFGPALDSVTIGSTYGLYSWDITSLVNDWVSGATANNGVALFVTEQSFTDPSAAAYVRFAGVPGGGYPETLGAAPVIVATPVPEPATLGLLALGGVFALRRRCEA